MSRGLRFERVAVARGGRTVLQVDDLELPAARVTFVVGPNGAGKSSLLLAGAGLLDLSAGRVTLDGRPFHSGRAPAPKALRRRIGIAFQEPYLFGGSVADNLAYPLELRGQPKPERAERVGRALVWVGLEAMAHRPAGELSGGERKRVALARALVAEPEVLLLDEVTAGLDEAAREQVEALLGQWAAERDACVVVSAHPPEPTHLPGSGLVRLAEGRLVEA